MNPREFNIYATWCLYTILGRMAEADGIVQQYQREVYAAAQEMTRRFPVKLVPLYRGVLVEPELIERGKLPPDPQLTFVSFSEDLQVACYFGKTDTMISGFVKEQRPGVEGYILEYKPSKPSEILFHHSWGSRLPMPSGGKRETVRMVSLVDIARMHPHFANPAALHQIDWNVKTQKEVILKPGPSLPAKPVGDYGCDATTKLDERFVPPMFARGNPIENPEKGKIFNLRAPVPPNVAQAFKALGYAQRGDAEAAMLRVHRVIGGGVLNVMVEHIGDLTHRMTHMVEFGNDGYEYVREKVKRAIYYLNNAYGFEREASENFNNNARYDHESIDVFMQRVNERLEVYQAAHAALPVYNQAQWLAREAAVAIGDSWHRSTLNVKEWYSKGVSRCRVYINALDKMTTTPEEWKKHVWQYELNPDGLVKLYTRDNESVARDAQEVVIIATSTTQSTPQVSSTPEVCHDCTADKRVVVSNAEDAMKLFWPFIQGEMQESYLLLCLDARRQAISRPDGKLVTLVAKGQRSKVAVDTADIVRESGALGADSIITAHGHPSNVCTPSSGDRDLWKRINKAFDVATTGIDVVPIDHLIIAHDGRSFYSLAESATFQTR
jgi:DNA repair protein RadC